jgi:hypothetical protein
MQDAAGDVASAGDRHLDRRGLVPGMICGCLLTVAGTDRYPEGLELTSDRALTDPEASGDSAEGVACSISAGGF